ncbi:MAG: protein-tyrosine phosphatase family protein [Bauldia sp.]
MPFVLVCPLSEVSVSVSASRASHLISLINEDTPVVRPDSITAENHLFLGINDITEPMDGMVLPGEEHVRQLIDFVATWDTDRPMVVHCFAGISRSTAAAFIAVCVTRPQRDERRIAARLRAAASFATPNARLVALADRMLGREGRMVAAVAEIGRGELAIQGVPFALAVEDDG